MSTLDKKYTIRLDTKSTFFNVVPQFSLSDNETSDFNIRITNNNNIINLKDIIIVMVAIDPNGIMHSDFLEVEKAEEGLVYCNLSQSLKNEVGTWKARLMCIYQQERIVTSTFSYKVNDDEFVQLNQEIVTDDRFGTLNDMLSRLSTIEIAEQTRVENETNRIEAEKQREIIKQELINDIEKLVLDTSKKVADNLQENSNRVTKLISDTETKIDNYKDEKDLAIEQDLQLYKDNTSKNIDDYKSNKDLEINKSLSDYKASTTTDINNYKSAKDKELDNYKTEKDLEIDNYVANKNKELDNYKLAKNTEINEFKDLKDTEINAKLREVDTAEQSRVVAEQKRVEDHQAREQFLNSFESQLEQIENKNGEQDNRLKEVEYKNKVQDVYINGLFNENKDGRLSIEGEGNELKLEGSKDGLVTVDKVVGDTLVNLCKENVELTLNGDISTEGTFVTTTEGVDNGLVDVMCQGDTLVNCRGSYLTMGANCSYDVATGVGIIDAYNDFTQIQFNNDLIQSGHGYTAIIDIKENTLEGQTVPVKIVLTNDSGDGFFNIEANQTGRIIKYLPSVTKTASTTQVKIRATTAGRVVFSNFMILEGDYTNKEIPPYFEGMKSVGQDDVNGHKIEILSQNKNLFDGQTKYELNTKRTIGVSSCVKGLIGKTTRKITFKADITTIDHVATEDSTSHWGLDIKFNFTDGSNLWSNFTKAEGLQGLGSNDTKRKFVFVRDFDKEVTIQSLENCNIFTRNTTGVFIMENIEIILGEDTSTQYLPHSSNKKEILLNEPLRGLPNGVKDRFVKMDGKWFIERNCGYKLLNGSEGWRYFSTSSNEYLQYRANMGISIQKKRPDALNQISDIADKIPVVSPSEASGALSFGIALYPHSDTTSEFIWTTNFETVDDLISWLGNNNVKFLYQRSTPIYEPLQIDPTLNTYTDVTHISNNSLIPCNMKVKNTGYSALLKDDTTYSMLNDVEGFRVGDTKVVGTVGAIGTNTDSIIRPFGKGKTLSKPLLLEGDYINKPTPQYFEGLQSTFEECKVTQEMIDSGLEKAENLGKYRVGVKVVGKNKFDGTLKEGYHLDINGEFEYQGFRLASDKIFVNKCESIAISYDVGQYPFHLALLKYKGSALLSRDIFFTGISTNMVGTHVTKTINVSDCDKIAFFIWDNDNEHVFNSSDIKDIQIEEGTVATSYEPYYERATAVYTNTPLLKDDIIECREDGIYHVKNRKRVTLDGSESRWGVEVDKNVFGKYGFYDVLNTRVGSENRIICNKYTRGILSGEATNDCQIIMYNHGGSIGGQIRIKDSRYSTLEEFLNSLNQNNLTFEYECEPVEEKISDDKLLLEIPNNATLSVESVIPCQSISASYTGNVPSVYNLEETGITNTNDIAVTQTAVDFLLMSSMGEVMMMSFKNDTKGGNNMGAYFASRIMKKALKYEDVIRKYPEFKEDIDFILRSEGYGDLIVEVQ